MNRQSYYFAVLGDDAAMFEPKPILYERSSTDSAAGGGGNLSPTTVTSIFRSNLQAGVVVKPTSAADAIKKPKRPLSAYNIFFKHHREQILASTPTRAEGKPRRSHGKIGFADLARQVAAKWNNIDPMERAHFDMMAAQDKQRHMREMGSYTQAQQEREEEDQQMAVAREEAQYRGQQQFPPNQSTTVQHELDGLFRNQQVKLQQETSAAAPSTLQQMFMSQMQPRQSDFDDGTSPEQTDRFLAAQRSHLAFLRQQMQSDDVRHRTSHHRAQRPVVPRPVAHHNRTDSRMDQASLDMYLDW